MIIMERMRVSEEKLTADQKFAEFVDEFFDRYFEFHPDYATDLGLHEYDSQLGCLSRAEIEAECSFLHKSLDRLERIDARRLSRENRFDYQILCSSIRSDLLDLEDARAWERAPNIYIDLIDDSILALIERDYAPAEARLRAVIEREKRAPDILRSAKANLTRAPKALIELAIKQCGASVAFFRKVVPAAFKEADDPALRAEFEEANDKLIRAYRDFIGHLKELLPEAQEDFALGADNLARMLLYEEMIDRPLDELLAFGRALLAETQESFRQTAARIDPQKRPAELLAEIEREHLPVESLIPTIEAILKEIKKFCASRRIITIPREVKCRVLETPEFMRLLTVASVDAPGPYETVATETVYHITPPESDWTPGERHDYLSLFNRYSLQVTSIHEAYPGHLVQMERAKLCRSKVRNLIDANSFIEGWAHYCEQMMLDEGFGDDDPKLRLVQLQLALVRLCRLIAGISLHTGEMSFQDAVRLFRKEAYLGRALAEQEALRGIDDPGYLVYALGKHEILALREEYQRARGGRFNLREFHDELTRHGAPPFKILRQILMQGPED